MHKPRTARSNHPAHDSIIALVSSGVANTAPPACAAVIPPRYMPLDTRATGKAFARASAVQPGSPFTRRFFAEHPMVLQVGSTVFVHGGLHPEHVHMGIDKVNSMSQVRSPTSPHPFCSPPQPSQRLNADGRPAVSSTIPHPAPAAHL